MKVNGSVSIIIRDNHVELEVGDEDSRINIVRAKMSSKDFCAALGRMSDVKAELEVADRLDLVGKRMENQTIKFPLSKSVKGLFDTKKLKAIASKEATEFCKINHKGWVSDNYFSSQGSFFDVDGQPWAQTTIRRWV